MATASEVLKYIGENKKYYFTTCTAVLSTIPLYAAWETHVAGMSDVNSLRARLFVTATTYLGIGLLFSKGREKFSEIYHVSQSSSDVKKTLADAAYGFAFNLALSPPLYFLTGERDWGTIGVATLGAAAFGTVSGYVSGLAIDLAHELMDIRQNGRLPRMISQFPSQTKKKIAYAGIAGIIAATGLVYATSPAHPQQSSLEKKVSP